MRTALALALLVLALGACDPAERTEPEPPPAPVVEASAPAPAPQPSPSPEPPPAVVTQAPPGYTLAAMPGAGVNELEPEPVAGSEWYTLENERGTVVAVVIAVHYADADVTDPAFDAYRREREARQRIVVHDDVVAGVPVLQHDAPAMVSWAVAPHTVVFVHRASGTRIDAIREIAAGLMAANP